MSIRTRVTLDDDVLERVKLESRSSGKPFKDTLNDLLRVGLLQKENRVTRKLKIVPVPMGCREGLNHDSVEALLAYGEGEFHG